MKPRRITVLALTGVALAAGGAGAIAATHDDPEQSVIEDAAKRLNVTPKALRDALAAAEKAHGMPQRGRHVLGFGPRLRGGPGPLGRGRFDHGGPGQAIDAAATALGLTRRALFEQLRSGKSLADIAKAQGKSLGDVKKAVRTVIATGLSQAVKERRLTQDRADEILKRFDERFDAFAQRSRPAMRPRGPYGPRWHHP
jgi:hypothetical protein